MKNFINIPAGKLAGENYQQYAVSVNNERQRNGFVTFWLWFGIVCSVISGITGFVSFQSIMSNLGYLEYQLNSAGIDTSSVTQIGNCSGIMICTTVVSAICCIIGYIMLLKWKKAGFWLLVIASIVISCINMYVMGLLSEACAEIGSFSFSSYTTTMQVVASVIGWIVLWVILQIKKSGVSCWSQLD